MRIHVKHLNLTLSTSTISLLSPPCMGSFFSFKHLAKVAAGYCRSSYGKPNVAIFNIAIFIQFNPYPFNLIFKFIQFNPRSFNSIPIVILFNPYSFNSIFRSIQFNFCILDSISLLVQFNFCIRSIQILCSFNLISVFIQFNCFIHLIQLLYSFDPIFIFIQFNPSIFIQSSHSFIQFWGLGQGEN